MQQVDLFLWPHGAWTQWELARGVAGQAAASLTNSIMGIQSQLKQLDRVKYTVGRLHCEVMQLQQQNRESNDELMRLGQQQQEAQQQAMQLQRQNRELHHELRQSRQQQQQGQRQAQQQMTSRSRSPVPRTVVDLRIETEPSAKDGTTPMSSISADVTTISSSTLTTAKTSLTTRAAISTTITPEIGGCTCSIETLWRDLGLDDVFP